MTGIIDLPPEILFNVFGLLPPSDLKNIVLVSKQWMVIGENPNLWTWAILSVNFKEDLLKLKMKRLQKVKKIKVTNWFHWSKTVLVQSTSVRPEELFEALLPITTLTSIESWNSINDFGFFTLRDTDYPDVSGIEPELFARVLSRLSCLSFKFINPTPLHLQALLSAIDQKQYHTKKLVFAVAEEQGQSKKLKVSSVFLSSTDFLATAISRFDSVCIYQGSDLLSKEQIKALQSKIGEDGSRLKWLKIWRRKC